MSKTKTKFVCQECGYEALKWIGQCPDCKKWNTFQEEIEQLEVKKTGLFSSYEEPRLLFDIEDYAHSRITTSFTELDRVLGGGIVPASLVLIGGPPGIGKSTLLLQVSNFISQNHLVLYVSGEESPQQIKLRATRLGLDSAKLYIVAETNLQIIKDYMEKLQPAVIIIDSIQTMYHPELVSAPGSVTQVRECTASLMGLCKTKKIALLLIGHITKQGELAGPKVLEHIVDTVLYFEGEGHEQHRIIRAFKNRFGATNEIGIFQMGQGGLSEVANPSEIFLAHRLGDTSGSLVIPVMEGSRPILVETQALVSYSGYAIPRRMALGIDANRLLLITAVLEKRLGLPLYNQDIYLNIVGGFRITETASDLGTALAIASSFKDKALDNKTVFLGEVGLGGEVRSVVNTEKRLSEAEKLGFEKAVIPYNNLQNLPKFKNMEVIGVKTVKEALQKGNRE